ncbi:hypothetical protein QQF64_028119 [Cirrhinus molitorella]|uniref:Uncharacterized protein n=1 Tax=Cirrhinus molitorella TaxID=172907 RepID=A0ABR3N613_9TELE
MRYGLKLSSITVRICALKNATYSVVFVRSERESLFLSHSSSSVDGNNVQKERRSSRAGISGLNYMMKRKRKKRLASYHWLLEISVHFYSALEEMASREDVPSNNKHDDIKCHSL